MNCSGAESFNTIRLVDWSFGRQPSFWISFGGERRLDAVDQLALAADIHHGAWRVMAIVHVREPVVCHELDPVGGEHIEEWRLLVIAVRVDRVAGQSETRIARGRG